jgi:hypothetical protein
VEVTQQAQHAFNTELQQRLKKTVWLSGCKSWYLSTPTKDGSSSGNPNGSKQGGQDESGSSSGSDSSGGGAVMWPGLVSEFWWRTLRPVAKDWVSGKAAHAVGRAGDAAAQAGKVLRKETPLQQLLARASFGLLSQEKKGM